MTPLEELKIEAEKSFNFNESHNIMTSQPEGVMAVSAARKLFNKAIEIKSDINLKEKQQK